MDLERCLQITVATSAVTVHVPVQCTCACMQFVKKYQRATF